ncbi:MAG: hypothetical protein JWQ84_2669 [Mucilaginibacter sp.]|nr:hypothetical protein [Mucilaginibacter sp.]MDB5017837.1 hypothetical protein [Mucilaginibacter sp.]
MKFLSVLTFFFFGFSALLSGQSLKHDTALIQKIDSMFKDDQFWRKEYAKVIKKEPSPYNQETIEERWAISDSLNELKAKGIISKYGYPGYNLVGEISNSFWAIVQHCDDDIPFQERVLALMKIEVSKNNASKTNYAYLVDRVLVGKHQKQIYGTQVYTDPKTHKSIPLPLKYPKQVNRLRKKMGMEPLEVYIKSFG